MGSNPSTNKKQTTKSAPQKNTIDDANLQTQVQPNSSESQQSPEHQLSSEHPQSTEDNKLSEHQKSSENQQLSDPEAECVKQDDHNEVMKKLKQAIFHLKMDIRKDKSTDEYLKTYWEHLEEIAYTYFNTDDQLDDYLLEISRELVTSGSITILCDIIVDIYNFGKREKDLQEDDFYTFKYSLSILHNFSHADQKDTPVICDHPTFLESSAHYLKQLKNDTDMEVQPTTDSILGTIHNVAMFDDNVFILRSLNYVDVLKPYLDSPNKKDRLTAIAGIAEIVNEEESEILEKGQNELSFLMELLDDAVQSKSRRKLGFAVWELTRMIRKIARNDTNKKSIVDLGFLPLLVGIAKGKDLREQREATGTLWTLSFGRLSDSESSADNYIQKEMASDTSIIDVLLSRRESPDADVAKSSKGALWTLREELIKNEKYKDLDLVKAFSTHQTKEQNNSEIHKSKGHVMISYQWSNQQIMIKVRDYLRNNGFKVWMDIDDMAGSTLEAMARAVEEAEVILMCFSKKYKDSDNCRAEAEYAFQKRKIIIPLKMEERYKADGWLGIIIGAKMFYDFSGKYTFESRTTALIKELEGKFSDFQEIFPQSVRDVSHQAIAVSPANEVNSVCQEVAVWTSVQVNQWLDKHGLDRSKFGKLQGVEIDYLQFLIERSPDSYTKALAEQLKIKDLLTQAKFTYALRNTTI